MYLIFAIQIANNPCNIILYIATDRVLFMCFLPANKEYLFLSSYVLFIVIYVVLAEWSKLLENLLKTNGNNVKDMNDKKERVCSMERILQYAVIYLCSLFVAKLKWENFKEIFSSSLNGRDRTRIKAFLLLR